MRYLIVLIVLFILSCNQSEQPSSKETNMRIDAKTQSCTGFVEGNCLLVQEGDKIGGDDWELFYFDNSIEDFVYEKGFVYDVVVKKTAIENPPADGSSISYKLIKIVSKKPAEPKNNQK